MHFVPVRVIVLACKMDIKKGNITNTSQDTALNTTAYVQLCTSNPVTKTVMQFCSVHATNRLIFQGEECSMSPNKRLRFARNQQHFTVPLKKIYN